MPSGGFLNRGGNNVTAETAWRHASACETGRAAARLAAGHYVSFRNEIEILMARHRAICEWLLPIIRRLHHIIADNIEEFADFDAGRGYLLDEGSHKGTVFRFAV
jgi:hypothetical protein